MESENGKCPDCGSPLEPLKPACPGCGRDVASLLSTQPPSSKRSAPDSVEKRIGEFRILRTMGRGGMGTVYEAYQESMHRKVALKVLDASLIPSTSEVARFEREAWIAGRLSHPNIVKVYSQGVENDKHFFAMELIEGQSLHAEIKSARERRQEQPISDSEWRREHIRRIVTRFVGVADALEHVHQQGIMHRDIKPLNLLLTKDSSRLLLTDFGLARDEEASRMTRKGDFIGTVRYMSPEQLLAHRTKIDRRSDIWSLGVSLYEAVTLDLPYSAESEEAYISAVSTKEPLPARRRNRAVPKDLETILMKCLERDPERRYGSAGGLREDLLRFLDDRPVVARRPGPGARTLRLARRNWRLLAAAAVAAALVGSLIALREHQSAKRLEQRQLRWALEQVLAKSPKPNSPPMSADEILPGWPDLKNKLHREIRHDRDGDLARLVRRAAVQVWARIPPFGRLAEEFQGGTFNHDLGFDPGLRFTSLAILEGSWDGGGWRPILRSVRVRESEGNYVTISLRGFLSPVELSPGPHSLDLRASLLILRPSSNTPPLLRDWQDAPISGSPETQWPSVAASEISSREVRSLGSFKISLFEEYPADFPKPIRETADTGTIESRFLPQILRIVWLRIPPGSGSSLSFEWSGKRQRLDLVCAKNAPSGRVLVVDFEIEGLFKPDDVLPIAADASVRLKGNVKPTLSFQFALGAGTGDVAPIDPDRECSSNGTNSVTTLDDGQERDAYLGALWMPSEVPPAGTYEGSLDLSPSRAVALRTQWLDRYLASQHSFPVRVEVVSVDAQWINQP